MPSPAVVFAIGLFSIFGMCAWMYGKRSGRWRAKVIGIALMLYPYLFSGTLALYSVGIALTIALFVWHD